MAAIFHNIHTTEQREQLFMHLYKEAFPAAAKYIRKMGGGFDDAKDIFQDALVIYYEKTVAGNLPVHSTDIAYLLGITRHLWLKKNRENNKLQPMDDVLTEFTEIQEDAPSARKLLNYLETTGQKCMDMLKAFYYDKLPVKEIATLFGYSGERSATVQKYKCLEKVRDTVKQKALCYEDFLE
ncbi:sigma-70 family RNA polymerase sigma factor [Mucilaginibacter limnophilus]|uniref:Sigma-70 family RNA polymerase sigma factor n=1 Tax=Mucilaginibacter limnophilus TaxID=1932778 RepID=A0A437MXL8_9SPHI|nr:sigma-70 family RNA polymerase sigma factor [Mucilaginibacter limnophilus]RVU02397.1 sigma-70 family RNA polymerase sigma factor [Mucilaginibacter limnophilus]